MADQNLTAERLRALLDYDPASGVFTWRQSRRVPPGSIAGHVEAQGYVVIKIGSRGVKAHRLAWLHHYGQWPIGEVDHIDGDRRNNTIANLRESDDRLNAQNQRRARSDNVLGVLGVRRYKRKFQARIGVRGKLIHIGLFPTAEEAHAAYVAAKRIMHLGCTL